MAPKIGGNNQPLGPLSGLSVGLDSKSPSLSPKKETGVSPFASSDSFERSVAKEVPIHIKKGREVVKKFDTKVEKILNGDVNRSAMSLAEGAMPTNKTENLSEKQQKAILDATTELFMDLPIGAMSPQMAAKARETIKKLSGKDPGDLNNTSLRELSDVGVKTAKALAADWRKNSPMSFYATAATVAAGIAYYGYSKGSAALDKIGIKPEIKKTFFNDHLEVAARVDWDEEFSNFRLSEGSVTARADINEHNKVHSTLKLGGFDEIKSVAAGYKLKDGKADLSLGIDHNYRESRTVLSGNLNNKINRDLTLGIGGSYDLKDSRPKVTFSGTYKPEEKFNLSAGLTVDALERSATGTLRGEYEVREDFNLALSGSFDSLGESKVGLGFTLKF